MLVVTTENKQLSVDLNVWFDGLEPVVRCDPDTVHVFPHQRVTRPMPRSSCEVFVVVVVAVAPFLIGFPMVQP